jgi:nucleoside-diphosphate-sugar epimerase
VRILVLGAGYVGAEVARQALARGDEVVLADNWYATEQGQLAGLAARVETVDIRQRNELAPLLAEGFDRVVLLAAQASRPLSVTEPDYTEETNLTGTRLVAELVPPETFVAFGSSLHIYGGGPRLTGEIGADHPYGPQDDLAHLSKIYGELVLDLHSRQSGFPLATLRLGIVYGPSPVEHADAESQTVVDKFRHLAAAGSPLPLDDGGRATVGVVHVGDVARIMLESPSRSGVSIDNVAAETLTVADVAALARGEPAAGEPACTFRSRFTYEHGVAEYLRVATPQGPGG